MRNLTIALPRNLHNVFDNTDFAPEVTALIADNITTEVQDWQFVNGNLVLDTKGTVTSAEIAELVTELGYLAEIA